MLNKIASFFKFDERKTSFKTETIAGITTFMTMAYVLIVQPALIVGGEAAITDINGVVITKEAILVTCAVISAVITLLMAFYANLPFALSTGMGSNALFGGLMGVLGMIVGVPLFAVIYAGIRAFFNIKLQKKGLPIEAYRYEHVEYIDQNGFHEPAPPAAPVNKEKSSPKATRSNRKK